MFMTGLGKATGKMLTPSKNSQPEACLLVAVRSGYTSGTILRPEPVRCLHPKAAVCGSGQCEGPWDETQG